jgi:TolB-like protein/DNA-binding SARP family transcriptional activator
MAEPAAHVVSFPEASSVRFELRCWGEFRLVDRLHGQECVPPARKARAIIAYLASHGESAISRERLAALLWSERNDPQARASLRQTLLQLRPYATVACPLLVIEREQVELNSPGLTTDAARLEVFARADKLEALTQALAEIEAPLFGGLDGLDPAFDEWLAVERRSQQDRLLSLGTAAAARGLEHSAHEAVSRLATELQALDETNETVAQIGMKADHACGDRSAVRRRYRRLCEALDQDLGVTPLEETERLLNELTGFAQPSSGPPLTQVAATPPPHSTPPCIAVLPFINRSDRQEDNVFADGMVEDLTAALSTSAWITVVAASATASYRTRDRDLRQIGRDLGVRYLLEGNVRRLSEDLRITAQLIEAESGSILWMQQFDRPFAELSTLQEELVTEVASHIGVQVERIEVAHALKQSGTLSAYQSTMRGLAFATRGTRSGWEAAVAEATRAVEVDPSGENYANLAAAQGQLLGKRDDADPQLAQEIADNIRRAHALGPHNPWVLCCIAAAWIGLGKLQNALPFAERAVTLSPNSDRARLVLGYVLMSLGRLDAALAELDTAERLKPNGHTTYYSSAWRAVEYLKAGRLTEAHEAAEQAVRLRPGRETLIPSMLCFAKLNRWNSARDALHRLRGMDPEMSCPILEGLVRTLFGDANAVDGYVAIARQLWNETASEPARRGR